MTARKRINLTAGMLDAIISALAEVEAGEGFQGVEGDEQDRMMDDLSRAIVWAHQELRKRKESP